MFSVRKIEPSLIVSLRILSLRCINSLCVRNSMLASWALKCSSRNLTEYSGTALPLRGPYLQANSTKNGFFYITVLKVSISPFQFYSSRMLRKSKCKGPASSSPFCPFFLVFGATFFFLAFPSLFLFSSSILFSSSAFLDKYSLSYFSLSSQ